MTTEDKLVLIKEAVDKRPCKTCFYPNRECKYFKVIKSFFPQYDCRKVARERVLGVFDRLKEKFEAGDPPLTPEEKARKKTAKPVEKLEIVKAVEKEPEKKEEAAEKISILVDSAKIVKEEKLEKSTLESEPEALDQYKEEKEVPLVPIESVLEKPKKQRRSRKKKEELKSE